MLPGNCEAEMYGSFEVVRKCPRCTDPDLALCIKGGRDRALQALLSRVCAVFATIADRLRSSTRPGLQVCAQCTIVLVKARRRWRERNAKPPAKSRLGKPIFSRNLIRCRQNHIRPGECIVDSTTPCSNHYFTIRQHRATFTA